MIIFNWLAHLEENLFTWKTLRKSLFFFCFLIFSLHPSCCYWLVVEKFLKCFGWFNLIFHQFFFIIIEMTMKMMYLTNIWIFLVSVSVVVVFSIFVTSYWSTFIVMMMMMMMIIRLRAVKILYLLMVFFFVWRI